MGVSYVIPKEEYKLRRMRCVEEAKKRGLKGLLVWSKGGGNVDRYADVMYLANYYSPFPHIPDNLPYWAGRAHGAVILPVDDEPVLLVDCPDYRSDLIMIDDVRFGLNLPKLAAEVLKEKNLGEEKVGFVANETMLVGTYKILLSELPNIEFEAADDILDNLRLIKSDNEIKIIKKAGEVGSCIMEKIMSNVEPGKTEAEILAEGIKETVLQGAAFYSFPTASGPNSNYYSYGTLPSWDNKRKLKNGDIFHVDVYGVFEGYYYDFSRSTVVGGQATDNQKKVLEGAKGVCEKIIKDVRPGMIAEDLARIGQEYLEKEGLTVPDDSEKGDEMVCALGQSFPAFGHGIGLMWEGPWLVPGDKTKIEKRMYLAIERSVGMPGVGTAAFEDNIVITENGAEVVSTAKTKWW